MNPLLKYLKAIIEGESELQPWSSWFEDNKNALSSLLSRGAYLRLKHNPIQEIPNVLASHGIPFDAVNRPVLPVGETDFSWIRLEWLTERVSPYSSADYQKAATESYLLVDLLRLVEIKREGDEPWHFRSPDATWRNKMGCAGIALVRAKEVVYAITLLMN